MDKSSDAFRTISEVADDLDLPQHVLRFWETRFAQIKPMKRGGGRRYYRPDDVDLLKGIRRLLYSEGYTIKGVQRILKDQGVRAVVTLGQGKGALDAAARARLGAGETDFGSDDDGFGDLAFVSVDELDAAGSSGETGTAPASDAPVGGHARYSPERIAQRFAPDTNTPPALPERNGQARRLPEMDETRQPTRSSFAPMIDRFRGVANRLSAEPTPVETVSAPGAQRGLSREELRRLQATLFDLLECKRLLDQTR